MTGPTRSPASTRRSGVLERDETNLVGGTLRSVQRRVERGQLARLDDHLGPLLPVPLPDLGQRRQRVDLHLGQRRQGLDRRARRSRPHARGDARQRQPVRHRHDDLLQRGRRKLGHVHRHGRRHRLRRLGRGQGQLPEPDRNDRRRRRYDEPVPGRLRLGRRQHRLGRADGDRPQQRRLHEPGDLHGYARHGAAHGPGRVDHGRLLHEPLGSGHPPERDGRPVRGRSCLGSRRARSPERSRTGAASPGAAAGLRSRSPAARTRPSLRTRATATATPSPTASATRPARRCRAWTRRSTRRLRSRATTLRPPGRAPP